jgi:hypothetical protein
MSIRTSSELATREAGKEGTLSEQADRIARSAIASRALVSRIGAVLVNGDSYAASHWG